MTRSELLTWQRESIRQALERYQDEFLVQWAGFVTMPYKGN